MITVKELTFDTGLKEFVTFPFSLFENNPYWVPPLIGDELENFNPDVNPVFDHADARFFMAYRDETPVGRIAAIINWIEVREQQIPKIRFGWLDAVDDAEVTEALLDEVQKWGKENGLDFMEGPVGFSNMDKAGMLVKGFEETGTMITWYSPPYYRSHMEQLGFEKAKEWVEFKIRVPAGGPPEKVTRFSGLILEKYDLKVIDYSNKQELMDHADQMFDLINQTYNNLSTFVPIQPEQVAYYKNKYFRFLHPDFITCVADSEDRLVAFAITMPSFAETLQKAQGRLFPFGWFHLLKARYFNRKADFYLIGIKPELQNKGLTAIIFKEMTEMFNRRNIITVETNPELEENDAIQALWKSYDSRLHKRRRTYRRAL